jgi:hypothetical protein
MAISDFILGPQVPITSDYFDQTQVAKARLHGEAFPAEPPADPDILNGIYTLANYYDLALGEYIAHRRTGDPIFLTYARKVADSWWKRPDWIGAGTMRPWPDTAVTPKFAGVGGLILRALDGRLEMWDWINSYTRFVFDHWAKKRIGASQLYYGVREGAFALHYATWLAKVLPDSFPLQVGGIATNGAQLRAAYLTEIQAVATGYFAPLQHPDGSWRWDSGGDEPPTDDGGELRGIMQPFQIGLLLAALIDVHILTGNEVVKTMILKACRHLYSNGPYAKDLRMVNFNINARGFHYFYHGGTTVNPTRYERGSMNVNTTERWHIESDRQAISTILPAYGYAYTITGDPLFKTAGDELFDSAYGGSDGFRAMMADTPKNFNQHTRRGASYKAWRDGVVQPPQPLPEPTPTPVSIPTPTPPLPTESPNGTQATSIVDSSGAKWTFDASNRTLRNGIHVGLGAGTMYAYVDKGVYVLGIPDSLGWYKWTGSGWVQLQGWKPPVGPVPTPPPVPEPIPVPMPQPEVYEYIIKTLPASTTSQLALMNEQGGQGYRLAAVIGLTAYFEKRKL